MAARGSGGTGACPRGSMRRTPPSGGSPFVVHTAVAAAATPCRGCRPPTPTARATRTGAPRSSPRPRARGRRRCSCRPS
eukprot:5454677-Alexandrium_andersonii.AAC.1